MTHQRQFSPEFKAQVVLEVVRGAKSAAKVCREYQLRPDLFLKWKAQPYEMPRKCLNAYGYRRLTVEVRRGRSRVNTKRVRRQRRLPGL